MDDAVRVEQMPRDHEYTCPFCGSEAYECKAVHADNRGDRFHCRMSMYHTFYPTDLHRPPTPDLDDLTEQE